MALWLKVDPVDPGIFTLTSTLNFAKNNIVPLKLDPNECDFSKAVGSVSFLPGTTELGRSS